MENWIGTTWPVFIGVTGVLFGLGAVLMGQALANTWRPFWHNIMYGVLLAAGARFMSYALFQSPLLLLEPYLVNFAYLTGLALLVYRMARVEQMVRQYPWLYQKAGIFGWRAKS